MFALVAHNLQEIKQLRKGACYKPKPLHVKNAMNRARSCVVLDCGGPVGERGREQTANGMANPWVTDDVSVH